MSTLGTKTSPTWVSSNLMADLMSLLSLSSSTPSSSMSSIMTSSSSSVMVDSDAPTLFPMALVNLVNSQDTGEKIFSTAETTPQTLRAYFSGFLLARVLGVISPQIRTMMVMTTVDTRDTVESFIQMRMIAMVVVARELAPMLTRLLPMRMVVRNLS